MVKTAAILAATSAEQTEALEQQSARTISSTKVSEKRQLFFSPRNRSTTFSQVLVNRVSDNSEKSGGVSLFDDDANPSRQPS